MVTLEQVKYQCRIDHDDEDALLTGYMASARDHVQMHLDRTIYEGAVPSDDPNGVIDNPSIDQATLMLIGHWYAHRESVSVSIHAPVMDANLRVDYMPQVDISFNPRARDGRESP